MLTLKQLSEVIISTMVVATPIPKAAEILLDTPRKGQRPKKRTSTKLFTIAAPKNKRVSEP